MKYSHFFFIFLIYFVCFLKNEQKTTENVLFFLKVIVQKMFSREAHEINLIKKNTKQSLNELLIAIGFDQIEREINKQKTW